MRLVEKVASQTKPYLLTALDHVQYPWVYSNDAELSYSSEDSWECRRVRIRGYFQQERFFVKRERAGKQGYLIFAPFVTAIKRLKKAARPAETSCMVMIGWVPEENIGDIELTMEPVEPLAFQNSPDEDDFNLEDDLFEASSITGLMKMTDLNPNEDDSGLPLTEIEGIIRKGEVATLAGKKNFEGHSFNVADLSLMANFFRLMNKDSASRYYIERIVDKEEVEKEEGEEEEEAEEEEEEGDMYPLPSSKNDFDDSAIRPAQSSLRLLGSAVATATGLCSVFM